MKKFIFVFSLLLSSQYAFGMLEQAKLEQAKKEAMIGLAAAGLGISIDAVRQLQQITPSDIGRKQEATCMNYRAVLANGDEIFARHFTQTNTSRCLRLIKDPINQLPYFIPLADNVINLLSGTYDLNVDPGT